MNQLGSTEENNNEDVLFMFEHDSASQRLDLELQRLGEETIQMGLLVNNIEERTTEDIVRWQRVLEDSSLEDEPNFLRGVSHTISHESGSSPSALADKNIFKTGINKREQQDLELTHFPRQQKKHQSWRAWFKYWFHRRGSNRRERESSDSDGLLVMNPGRETTDGDGNNNESRLCRRVHSTVRARNFSDHALDSSSSITLAERKYYFFGDNNRPSLTTSTPPMNPRSSSESIISESTPSQHIAQSISMKYNALTHDSTLTAAFQKNDEGYLKSSYEIATPALLQSPQPKKSKSTSHLLTFRQRCSLRKGHYRLKLKKLL